MITASNFRNGLCIEINNTPYIIVEFQHVKPGKGNAFVRTKLKNLLDQKVIDYTFPSGHKIKDIRVEKRPHQYLYKDAVGCHFMNQETFEQITLQKETIGNVDLMKEGQIVEILLQVDEENRIISTQLPTFVDLEVTYTEPGVKGNTVSTATKPAKLETQAVIQVPLFINQGEIIRVDTRNRSYSERVK